MAKLSIWRRSKSALSALEKISDIYLKICAHFLELSIEVCGISNPSQSQQKAARFSVPQFVQPDEIRNNPNIDCILILTIPGAHEEVSARVLQAGKHV